MCCLIVQADAKLEEMLLECAVVTEYVDAVLLDERDSLEDPAIYEFMQHYYPKVCTPRIFLLRTLKQYIDFEMSKLSNLI